jgi:hypothetical protein
MKKVSSNKFERFLKLGFDLDWSQLYLAFKDKAMKNSQIIG